MEQVLAPELVEKELIREMTFRKSIQLNQDPHLQKKISDAMLLGNSYHTKVSIIFCDDEGLKKVNTTIWANGNKYICLKGGTWLPVDRILEIELV